MRCGSALVRRRANLRGIAVVIGLLMLAGNLLYVGVGHAATLPTGFADRVVLSGLTQPTNVEFSPDGRVFVAEKSGLITNFDNLSDTTPTVFADLRTQEQSDVVKREIAALTLGKRLADVDKQRANRIERDGSESWPDDHERMGDW